MAVSCGFLVSNGIFNFGGGMEKTEITAKYRSESEFF
jgi:hypothetical protein